MKKRLLVTMLSMVVALGAVGCSQAPLEPAKNISEAEEAPEKEPESKEIEDTDEEATEETSKAKDDSASGEFTSGVIKGNSYENDFFNIKVTLDDNFTFASDEELKDLNGSLGDMDSIKDNEMAKKAVDDGAVMAVAFATDLSNGSTFNVTIQSVGSIVGALVDEKTVLEQGKQSAIDALEAQGFTDVTAEIENFTFLGEEHPTIVMKGSVQGIPVHERSVCLIKGGYISLYSVLGLDADSSDAILTNAEKLN